MKITRRKLIYVLKISVVYDFLFFLGINDSHCGRINSSLIVVHCFDDGYVGKQPASWKKYCAEESIDRMQDLNAYSAEIRLLTITNQDSNWHNRIGC